MNGCDARGLLHPYLLLLLYERPGHGYELIGRLGGSGVGDVEPGHAYRVLRSLERDGLVISSWVPSDTGPARRRYELTPAGVEHLGAWTPRLAHLGQVIAAFLDRWKAASCGRVDGERAASWS